VRVGDTVRIPEEHIEQRVVMASETPQRVSIWSFHLAPPDFRELFSEGGDADWVVYVPPAQRRIVEPSLLRWRDVYPVRSVELTDRSVVYCGAPREAMQMITKKGKSVVGPTPDKERRAADRVQIVYPIRYETHTQPKQIGMGHTIDMSNGGIAFTTESFLPANAPVTLHVAWPVRLDGTVPIELIAAGRLARTEAMRAALQLDRLSFSIVE
jgi:PilZ domain-containing protein